MPELYETHEPVKDEESAHPIADAWRPTLQAIVAALVRGDFGMQGVASVEPLSQATADQIRKYIASYGEKLAPLPEAAWETSVAQWMGSHWEVLVDLWTVESGASDLVLMAMVSEVADGFRFEVDSVHVP